RSVSPSEPKPLDKSATTCCLNSSHIFPDCKICPPIPGLACTIVAYSHTSIRGGWTRFEHRSHMCVRQREARLQQTRFACEEFRNRLARTGQMRTRAVDDDFAGTRAGGVVRAHRERI